MSGPDFAQHEPVAAPPAIESMATGNQSAGDEPEKLSVWLRWFNACMGLGILTVFGIAISLRPSPDGMGTHQQLGLPPCTTVALFGVRWPSCGMTTSWSLFVRGDWIASVQVNAGGFLLAVIALAYLPASCYLSLRGQASRGGWLSLSLALGLVTALVVAFLQWAWRLAS